MKTAFIALLFLTIIARGEVAADKRAQATAVVRYPQLGVKGSAFNDRFLAIVAQAREEKAAVLDDPQWPLRIAELVSDEMAAAKARETAKSLLQEAQDARVAVQKAAKTIKELETDLVGIIGTKFSVIGTIDVAKYYNYGFKDTEEDFFSFRIQDETGSAHVYMLREEGAKLRAKILAAKKPIEGVFMLFLPKGVAERGQGELLAILLDGFPPLDLEKKE